LMLGDYALIGIRRSIANYKPASGRRSAFISQVQVGGSITS
jgi:hypothetical protein